MVATAAAAEEEEEEDEEEEEEEEEDEEEDEEEEEEEAIGRINRIRDSWITNKKKKEPAFIIPYYWLPAVVAAVSRQRPEGVAHG